MKSCKVCSKHCTGDYCMAHKPRKPLQTKTRLTAKKPMNRIGKVQKKTYAATSKWKKQQKPTHEGYYICEYCGKWIEDFNPEHMNSKVRRPDQRTDTSNFAVACASCNEKKLSKSAEEFKQRLSHG